MYITAKKKVFWVIGDVKNEDFDTNSLIHKYLKLRNLIYVKTARKGGLLDIFYYIYAKNMHFDITFLRNNLVKTKRLFNFAAFFESCSENGANRQ